MSNLLVFVIMLSETLNIIGLASLITGIKKYNRIRKTKANCTASTYGKVTDIIKCKWLDTEKVYSSDWNPEYEYNVRELKSIEKSNYGNSQPEFSIGQNVKK